jgi:hypothetical protein
MKYLRYLAERGLDSHCHEEVMENAADLISIFVMMFTLVAI